MTDVFLKIADLGIEAGFLIAAVLLARLLLSRTSKSAVCLLWVLVAARLLVPVQVQSVFSLVPDLSQFSSAAAQQSADAAVNDQSASAAGQISVENAQSGTKTSDANNNSAENAKIRAEQRSMENGSAVKQSRAWLTGLSAFVGIEPSRLAQILTAVWLTGIMGMLVYLLVSVYRLRRQTAARVLIGDTSSIKVYQCDEVDSPFILGVFRPVICLPSGMEKETAASVLRHERAHIRRGDMIWKPFGFLLLAVYWFCPLCWIAYVLFCRDMEFACDEQAVRGMDGAGRADYCQALLDCGKKRRLLSVCPVAFGEIGVKKRIRAVARYKKPTFWAAVATLALCAFVAVCFFTSPADKETNALAGTESDTEAVAEAESETEMDAMALQEIDDFAGDWARAFEGRDGALIREYATTQTEDALEERGILTGDSFGVSSPWPWKENEHDIWVTYDESKAEIWYYVLTSDPHVTVWKETLTYTYDLTKKQYQVTSEELCYYDSIASGAEFTDAYMGGISSSNMNYKTNGMGRALNETANADLYEAAGAAKKLLNLLDDENKVTVEDFHETSPTFAVEKISFLEDGVTVYVSMEKEWGSDGIWIPRDWSYDADTLAEDAAYYPNWMQEGSVIIYDADGNPTIVQGGELSDDDYESREDEIASIGEDHTEEMLVCPNTKVEYDLHGFIQNIYYLVQGTTDEYQLEKPQDSDTEG